MDMEIHSCLSWLEERGMANGKKLDQLEDERQAVIGSRLWLAVSGSLTSQDADFVSAFQATIRVRLRFSSCLGQCLPIVDTHSTLADHLYATPTS